MYMHGPCKLIPRVGILSSKTINYPTRLHTYYILTVTIYIYIYVTFLKLNVAKNEWKSIKS